MAYQLTTAAKRPDLEHNARTFGGSVWPEFMLHDAVVDQCWDEMYERYRDFQLLLIDEHDTIVALANCAPLAWDGGAENLPSGGIDWILTETCGKPLPASPVNALFAIQIVVDPPAQGKGLSAKMVMAMAARGKEAGCDVLYAPVRPTWKHKYPLASSEQYIKWRRDDDTLFDPWLRVHERVGGAVIRVCEESMRIEGTIAEWESWTEMLFPESGDYIIPGALVPVTMDIENDRGLYIEPNVWVRHGG